MKKYSTIIFILTILLLCVVYTLIDNFCESGTGKLVAKGIVSGLVLIISVTGCVVEIRKIRGKEFQPLNKKQKIMFIAGGIAFAQGFIAAIVVAVVL